MRALSLRGLWCLLLLSCSPEAFLAQHATALQGSDPVQAAAAEAARAVASIQEKDARALVFELAAPDMEGRRAGSRGSRKAAERIAREFQKAGLVGLGENGSFLIPFKSWAAVPREDGCKLTVQRSGSVSEARLGTDFLPVIGSGGSEASGEPVFAGYAIKADEFGYDDFAATPVKGKVAVCLWREPRHGKDGEAFKGKEVTRHSSIRHKAAAAAQAGAVALLVVPDPLHTKETGPLGFQLPWATASESFGEALGEFRPSIPIATVSLAFAEKLLGRSLKEQQNAIERNCKPVPARPVAGVTVTVAAAVRMERVEMHNVAARLPGTDPELADDAVVLGCHYDHDGTSDDGQVYAGADDNASGTTALLLTARAFGLNKVHTRRSVVFAAFSAEERGLIGSDAFVRAGPLTKEHMAAMLQMDMVGRARDGRVFLLGTKYSRDLTAVLKKTLAARPLKLNPDWDEGSGQTNQFWRRSDHWSFARRGVPAVFLFTGEHPDYHKPVDTPDKIDTRTLAEVSKLAFGFAHLLATQDARPARLDPPSDR